jgi:hypothetical protein
MAKLIDPSHAGADVSGQSFESTIYDSPLSIEQKRDPFYDADGVVTSVERAETVVSAGRAWKCISQIESDAKRPIDEGETDAWPALLESLGRLSQLARPSPAQGGHGPDQTMAREALAAILAELGRITYPTDENDKKYSLARSSKYDNIVLLIHAFDIYAQHMQTADQAQATPVANLLEKQCSIAEIRGHIRQQIAPSASDLVGPLNSWLKAHIATTLPQKEEICSFINDLLSISGLSATCDNVPCYFRVSKRSNVPDGVIYLMPFGGDRQLAARNQFADIPDIGVTAAPNDITPVEQNNWVFKVAATPGGKRKK